MKTKIRQQLTLLAALAALALVASAMLAACSDDSENEDSCPPCESGYACNDLTKQCEPVSTASCSPRKANDCGSEFTYCADTTCLPCASGSFNCDGLDACEAQQACSVTNTCSASKKNDCSSEFVYCAGTACQPCSSGMYNCDGVDVCESDSACNTSSGCDPLAVDDCDGAGMFCDAATNTCQLCPADTYNCDGLEGCTDQAPCICDPAVVTDCGGVDWFCGTVGSNNQCQPCAEGSYNCDGLSECENADNCQTDTCNPTCTSFDEYLCVIDPVKKRCESCLTTADCLKNPRAQGPRCDTSNLAGTGSNFCVCDSDTDCATSTMGLLCRAAAGTNPNLKQCTCETGENCPAAHPICEGEFFKRCKARCVDNTGCVKGGVQGYCDVNTGLCSYPDYL